MTPLARSLAKQLMLPIRKRDSFWTDNSKYLRSALDDIHCFEVTDCLPMINDLAEMWKPDIKAGRLEKCDEVFRQLAFLPAPKTWIEWKWTDRIAILLEEECYKFDQKKWHNMTVLWKHGACNFGMLSSSSGDYWDGYPGREQLRYFPDWLVDRVGDRAGVILASLVHHMLLIINSPKIIGRQQHMPHAGLERKLLKEFAGSFFPLHAWTEIKLQVAKPIEIDDGQPHEAHLTGQRALHFVRKHIRIRFGKLEYVSAHWRGDPSIGIKRSKYKVVA